MPLKVTCIVIVWFVVGAFPLAFADNPTSQPTTREALRSFKGWELYAWREGDAWQFSLLVGTNRNKTDDEITDRKLRLADVAAVKAKLTDLAAGEWVTLSPRKRGGEVPPDTIQKELKTFCDGHQLHWQ